MNEEQVIRRLAMAARGDVPPPVDVTQSVLADMPVAVGPRNVLLWAFTAASSAAATAAVLLAVQVIAMRQDPFGDYLESMVAVMQ